MLHSMSSSLLLWIVSQKRFVLRMKLIQCEIKSPVLYLREAHRGHSWWWASRLFPSVLTALQATCACVCTRKHALPTQHNTTQHWYTYYTHVTFKLFNITVNDISIQIQFLAWAIKSPQRSERIYTKDKFSLPLLHTFFFVWQPRSI